MPALDLPQPYLLFLGDLADPRFAKTAVGLRDWAPEVCVGEFALPSSTVSLGLPRMTPAEAVSNGAKSLVIGVTPIGGALPQSWILSLREAMEAGLDLLNGLHTSLATVDELQETARRLNRQMVDVRHAGSFPIATGRRRSGRRLLTVGTDCALGKKYTALALARAFSARGVDAQFRATGQTGILIAGEGVPMDAVTADFLAGAAESLTPDANPDHWDVVEGQGSVFHPAYAGVSLGLLHGTQPDVIVLCNAPNRQTLVGFSNYVLPGIEEAIDLTLTLARRVNPESRCAGVSLNTADMAVDDARSLLQESGAILGLPCADPMRGGPEFEALVSACLATSGVGEAASA